MIQIKHYITGEVLYEGEHETLRDAVEAAVAARASLDGASLDGASLPERVTWEEFRDVVVPALLVAGGKDIASFAESWQCNTWENCPMHHAFNAQGLGDVPVVWRPWAERFVQLFDAGLIPWKSVAPKEPTAA